MPTFPLGHHAHLQLAAALASWSLAEHAHGLDSTLFTIFGWAWLAISCIYIVVPRIRRHFWTS